MGIPIHILFVNTVPNVTFERVCKIFFPNTDPTVAIPKKNWLHSFLVLKIATKIIFTNI